MREHDHEHADSDLRPRSSRLEDHSTAKMRAALSGRPEATTPEGLLGLQRAAGNAGTATLFEEQSPVHEVVGSGGGNPLEPAVRTDMETRLGHDFGDVRVHTDDRAHRSATSVNAHAYTVGSDIVFQRDAYDPHSDAGRHTLAHELTHVVQQRQGPVDGTDTGGGLRVSDPSDRFEREAVANADRAMAAPANPATADPAVQRAVPDVVVQREETEEEVGEEPPTAQTFVQREASEDEEEA